jgi:molybdenum cofactor cytidylyltransferase
VSTAAVVLAAGSGSRFAGDDHKLLTVVRGRPVVAHAVAAAVAAGHDDVLVVVGAVDLRHLLPDDVVVVENPRWAEGQATSVGAALVAAAERGHDAVVVGLGDQPFVGSGPWQAVAAADERPIAVATYDGQRRNPVRLHRSVWELVPTDGDEGARSLIRRRSELVQEVPCEGVAADIDTLEDLEQWT